MKMNSAGLALIKKFEGFRSRAYRDAVGVWTIGYGHTSKVGAPIVRPEMKISRREAEIILARDIEKFATKIRPLIKVRLNDNQFSALVSFAYNVGPGGFARSSVLARVNRGEFDAVPHRLALWVKAGGRTLRGLVRRRAAEGELFLSKSANIRSIPNPEICPSQGKPISKSSTVFAAFFSAVAAIGSWVLDQGRSAPFLAICLMVLILVASGWIIYERIKKSKTEGV